MLQCDLFIFIRFFHFRPISATNVISVDYRRKSIQSPWFCSCRKHQRLPPFLLIENASDRRPRFMETFLPEAFPIEASDNSEIIPFAWFVVHTGQAGTRSTKVRGGACFVPLDTLSSGVGVRCLERHLAEIVGTALDISSCFSAFSMGSHSSRTPANSGKSFLETGSEGGRPSRSKFLN